MASPSTWLPSPQPRTSGDSDASPTDISFLLPLMGNKAIKEGWNILKAGGTEGRAGTRFLPISALPRLWATGQSSVPLLPRHLRPVPYRGTVYSGPASLKDQEHHSAQLCVSGTQSGPGVLRK